MTLISCPGVVVTDASGVAQCQDMTGAPLAWEAQQEFSIDSLDTAMISGAFSAGFVVVAIGMVVGMGFRVVLSLLK
jgi:hypothetical protein